MLATSVYPFTIHFLDLPNFASVLHFIRLIILSNLSWISVFRNTKNKTKFMLLNLRILAQKLIICVSMYSLTSLLLELLSQLIGSGIILVPIRCTYGLWWGFLLRSRCFYFFHMAKVVRRWPLSFLSLVFRSTTLLCLFSGSWCLLITGLLREWDCKTFHPYNTNATIDYLIKKYKLFSSI